MTSRDELDDFLKQNRPPTMRRGEPLDQRRELLLEDIVHDRIGRNAPDARTSRRTVSSLLIAAALVLLTVIGIATQTIGNHSTSAFAVTPRPLKAQQIDGDVDMVLTRLSESIAAPRKQRVQFQSWALLFTPETSPIPTAIQPQETTIDEKEDGTVTLKTVVVGNFDAAGDSIEVDDGLKPGSVLMDEQFAPGEYPYLFPEVGKNPDWAVYLRDGYGLAADATTGDYFTAIRGLLSERTLTAEQQASLLRFIAKLPDVRVDGEVTDRLGRPGISISATTRMDGEYRDVLVLAEGAGIVAYESVYVGTERTDLRAPAVIDYTAWK